VDVVFWLENCGFSRKLRSYGRRRGEPLNSSGGKLPWQASASEAEIDGVLRSDRRQDEQRTLRTGKMGGCQSCPMKPSISAVCINSGNLAAIEAAVALLANPDIGVTQIAHRLNVSPATLYRYIPAARAANAPDVERSL
jgi:hypothetical protein